MLIHPRNFKAQGFLDILRGQSTVWQELPSCDTANPQLFQRGRERIRRLEMDFTFPGNADVVGHRKVTDELVEERGAIK